MSAWVTTGFVAAISVPSVVLVATLIWPERRPDHESASGAVDDPNPQGP
ncbi:hypothetical protein OG225_02860 [Nocardia sp. NBC_01377]